MTNAVWLRTKTNLGDLIEYLEERNAITLRKHVLLLAAYCRRLWHLLPDDSRAGVVYAEALADDPNDENESWPRELHCRAPEYAIYELPEGDPRQWAAVVAHATWGYPLTHVEAYDIVDLSTFLLIAVWAHSRGSPVLSTREFDQFRPSGSRRFTAALQRESAAHCDLLRDIFGNPFRPVVLAPDWRTSTVVALTRQMYDSRDFSLMPILADALQDAGCDVPDILDHCRDPQLTHVRGCWVVDLVLGRG